MYARPEHNHAWVLKWFLDCDGTDFERPIHYIRHTGTLQVPLSVDMGPSEVRPQRL